MSQEPPLPHYLVQFTRKKEFCVRLNAPNGDLLLYCMVYATHSLALAAVANVRSLAPIESRYQRTNSARARFSYRLRDAAGLIVGRGDVHLTAVLRDAAIRASMAHGPGARLADLTSPIGASPTA